MQQRGPIRFAIFRIKGIVTALANEKQPGLLAGECRGGPVDAGGDRAARIIDGNTPEVAEPEGKRLRLREGGIMQVVTIFSQVLTESVVIFPAKETEEGGTDPGNIGAPLRFVIAQAFGRGRMITAKISVGIDRGTVHVERINIRRHGPCICIAGIIMNAIKDGGKTTISEELLVP